MLHAKAELLKFSVYLSYSLHGEGLLILIILSIISASIGYLCARILRDINRLILILLSIIALLIVAMNKETYVGFLALYSSFFIIIGILLYRKKKDELEGKKQDLNEKVFYLNNEKLSKEVLLNKTQGEEAK